MAKYKWLNMTNQDTLEDKSELLSQESMEDLRVLEAKELQSRRSSGRDTYGKHAVGRFPLPNHGVVAQAFVHPSIVASPFDKKCMCSRASVFELARPVLPGGEDSDGSSVASPQAADRRHGPLRDLPPHDVPVHSAEESCRGRKVFNPKVAEDEEGKEARCLTGTEDVSW